MAYDHVYERFFAVIYGCNYYTLRNLIVDFILTNSGKSARECIGVTTFASFVKTV